MLRLMRMIPNIAPSFPETLGRPPSGHSALIWPMGPVRGRMAHQSRPCHGVSAGGGMFLTQIN
jgi:hypothetical protein